MFRKVCSMRQSVSRALSFSRPFLPVPLFISPTRKPRAGLNTRANPIRCKCFRARPSPSLSRSFSHSLPLPLSLSLFPFRAHPVSPSLSSDFFVERLSCRELADISHTELSFTAVYARGLKLHVAQGCVTTSSRTEKESKFTG